MKFSLEGWTLVDSVPWTQEGAGSRKVFDDFPES